MLKLYFAQQLCANSSHSRGLNTQPCGTAMLRISREKLWLSGLTDSDVRISHPWSQDIQLNTDAVRGDGNKCQVLTFSHLRYAFLWGTRLRRVAKVTALAALLKPVNWRSQGVKSIMVTGTSVTVLLHVIHQFKTGQREVQHWRTSAAIWHWQQPSKLW